LILGGGTPGKRYALPNAKLMIHQGTAGTKGAPRDMEIQLREVLATTRRMAEIISMHTGQPLDKVERDLDRDYFMTPEEAKAYGLIDEIIQPAHRPVPPAVTEMPASEPEPLGQLAAAVPGAD
jgi:ATP-dependent Clp protease protease subunit